MWTAIAVVAWAASTLAAESAHIRADRRARYQSQQAPALPPCAPCVQEPCAWSSPCMPDFSDVHPDKPITEADVAAANQQAFVNQVIVDEDKRIQQAALIAVKEELEKAKKQQELEAELEAKKKQAQSEIDMARQQAAEQLANATSAVVQDVMRRAAEMGQASQLAKDQQVMAELLRKQAEQSVTAAQNARARATEDQMRAEAAAKAAEETTQAASASKQVAMASSAAAAQAAANNAEMEQKARNMNIAAGQEAARQVLQAQNTVRGIKVVAKKAVKDMAEADEVISDAQAAPLAFSRGVQKGISGY